MRSPTSTFTRVLLSAALMYAVSAAVAVQTDEHFDTLEIAGLMYTNVTITSVTATDVFFSHSQGLGNAKLKMVSPELREHFRFNSGKAGDVEKAQAKANADFHAQLAHEQAKPHAVVDYSREPEPQVADGLETGKRFPGFAVHDTKGNDLSIQALKGKVVLIDFWATWCPPCRALIPEIVQHYKAYHTQGLEVVGISLDQDENQLNAFTQQNGMEWPQYFDGRGWENELAHRYGVRSIPTTYLLDRHGIIIGKGLRGEQLAEAIAKEMAK